MTSQQQFICNQLLIEFQTSIFNILQKQFGLNAKSALNHESFLKQVKIDNLNAFKSIELFIKQQTMNLSSSEKNKNKNDKKNNNNNNNNDSPTNEQIIPFKSISELLNYSNIGSDSVHNIFILDIEPENVKKDEKISPFSPWIPIFLHHRDVLKPITAPTWDNYICRQTSILSNMLHTNIYGVRPSYFLEFLQSRSTPQILTTNISKSTPLPLWDAISLPIQWKLDSHDSDNKPRSTASLPSLSSPTMSATSSSSLTPTSIALDFLNLLDHVHLPTFYILYGIWSKIGISGYSHYTSCYSNAYSTRASLSSFIVAILSQIAIFKTIGWVDPDQRRIGRADPGQESIRLVDLGQQNSSSPEVGTRSTDDDDSQQTEVKQNDVILSDPGMLPQVIDSDDAKTMVDSDDAKTMVDSDDVKTMIDSEKKNFKIDINIYHKLGLIPPPPPLRLSHINGFIDNDNTSLSFQSHYSVLIRRLFPHIPAIPFIESSIELPDYLKEQYYYPVDDCKGSILQISPVSTLSFPERIINTIIGYQHCLPPLPKHIIEGDGIVDDIRMELLCYAGCSSTVQITFQQWCNLYIAIGPILYKDMLDYQMEWFKRCYSNGKYQYRKEAENKLKNELKQKNNIENQIDGNENFGNIETLIVGDEINYSISLKYKNCVISSTWPGGGDDYNIIHDSFIHSYNLYVGGKHYQGEQISLFSLYDENSINFNKKMSLEQLAILFYTQLENNKKRHPIDSNEVNEVNNPSSNTTMNTDDNDNDNDNENKFFTFIPQFYTFSDIFTCLEFSPRLTDEAISLYKCTQKSINYNIKDRPRALSQVYLGSKPTSTALAWPQFLSTMVSSCNIDDFFTLFDGFKYVIPKSTVDNDITLHNKSNFNNNEINDNFEEVELILPSYHNGDEFIESNIHNYILSGGSSSDHNVNPYLPTDTTMSIGSGTGTGQVLGHQKNDQNIFANKANPNGSNSGRRFTIFFDKTHRQIEILMLAILHKADSRILSLLLKSITANPELERLLATVEHIVVQYPGTHETYGTFRCTTSTLSIIDCLNIAGTDLYGLDVVEAIHTIVDKYKKDDIEFEMKKILPIEKKIEKKIQEKEKEEEKKYICKNDDGNDKNEIFCPDSDPEIIQLLSTINNPLYQLNTFITYYFGPNGSRLVKDINNENKKKNKKNQKNNFEEDIIQKTQSFLSYLSLPESITPIPGINSTPKNFYHPGIEAGKVTDEVKQSIYNNSTGWGLVTAICTDLLTQHLSISYPDFDNTDDITIESIISNQFQPHSDEMNDGDDENKNDNDEKIQNDETSPSDTNNQVNETSPSNSINNQINTPNLKEDNFDQIYSQAGIKIRTLICILKYTNYRQLSLVTSLQNILEIEYGRGSLSKQNNNNEENNNNNNNSGHNDNDQDNQDGNGNKNNGGNDTNIPSSKVHNPIDSSFNDAIDSSSFNDAAHIIHLHTNVSPTLISPFQEQYFIRKGLINSQQQQQQQQQRDGKQYNGNNDHQTIHSSSPSSSSSGKYLNYCYNLDQYTLSVLSYQQHIYFTPPQPIKFINSQQYYNKFVSKIDPLHNDQNNSSVPPISRENKPTSVFFNPSSSQVQKQQHTTNSKQQKENRCGRCSIM